MSSTDLRDRNYTFEIKFGAYHQKVTITMSPFSLTMNTLREVAIRFIETMVRRSSLMLPNILSLFSASSVPIRISNRCIIVFYSSGTNRRRTQ